MVWFWKGTCFSNSETKWNRESLFYWLRVVPLYQRSVLFWIKLPHLPGRCCILQETWQRIPPGDVCPLFPTQEQQLINNLHDLDHQCDISSIPVLVLLNPDYFLTVYYTACEDHFTTNFLSSSKYLFLTTQSSYFHKQSLKYSHPTLSWMGISDR